MKILNKNKIIVSALALAIGGSLAGSVGSTIAWYQYSTRANVSYIGEASGVSSNFQMRFKSESADEEAWRTRITWDEMDAELHNGGFAEKLVPMTFGKLNKDDPLPAKGYTQPAPGVGDMTKWIEATEKNYAQFTLQLRNINREGATAANDAQDVYLSKLVLQKDLKTPTGKEDISNALRVHISSVAGSTTKNKLISKLGGDTKTSGKLDIDGDGHNDQAYPEDDEFGFGYDGDNHVALEDVIYGDQNNDKVDNETQASYSASYQSSDANAFLVYSENNILYNDQTKSVLDNAKSIGQTLEGSSGYLEVTITIWLEGWQEFEDSAIWNATKYVDSMFDVGIQFAIQDRQ